MKVGTILNIKKKDKICTAVVKLYDYYAKFLTSHKQHQHYINSRLSKYDIVAGLVEHYRYG